jgi:predicted enzyme related to lactoylglutathione lyase
VDISVTDIGRSQAFYREVLGWEFTEGEPEFGGYCTALVGGRGAAGMSPPMQGNEGAPSVWTTYLAVADSAGAEAAIMAAGGQVVFGSMPVGDQGVMGLYSDPTGAFFGTWQSGQHLGFAVANEPGAVTWCEGMVGDFETGKAFYADAFGFTYTDMSSEAMPYAMFSVPGGERPAGGIGGVSGGQPAGWTVTFEVEGTDAAVARVRDNGGEVITEAFDFDYGRIAVVSGPDGETFGLITSAPM